MDYTVNTDSKGLRLDVFAAERTGLTRSRVKTLIGGGAVAVNGKAVKGGFILRAGDIVSAEIPAAPAPAKLAPEDIPFTIVYEDGDLAVIDKPRGLTVHPAGGKYTGTLVNALLFRLKNLSGINGEIRPGIVHRLDKMTSGLMAVAKNDAAHLSLSRQIAEKTAERIYRGIVEGVVKEDGGVIDQPLGRDAKDRKKIAVRAGGRRAVTRWRVVKRFKQNTLVEFKLETGRTHQIRVHCRFMGYPIVGDKEYGFKKQRFNLPGQMLHACRLSFNHPATGERMTFQAELPEDFRDVLKKLKDG
ncbi:MAG: RluA family pseudouridine synthase [Clostridiales bacterium]|jgi:23S rRNA pseudouridine1911/1915/1917 synthase|nr:RluA family pseudouridine synthase [Clostridiales bacterium]